VDQLTKVAHFLPVHTTDKAHKYAELYIDRIVCLHGLPRTIVSDRGAQFIARFWEQLQESLGTKLIRSSAYHPHTDGQTKRVNQILEAIIRACAIDYEAYPVVPVRIKLICHACVLKLFSYAKSHLL
jgi:transposase InsO family protein